MKTLFLFLALSGLAHATEDMPTYGIPRTGQPVSYLSLYVDGKEKGSYDVMGFSLQAAGTKYPARIVIAGTRSFARETCAISKALAEAQGMSLGDIALLLQGGVSVRCDVVNDEMATSFWIYAQ